MKIWFGYWFKSWSIFYKIGFAIVRTGIRTYFKKYEMVNFDKLPKDSGLIFASNHQNAFLDPIILAANLKTPVYFLSRADIFKKKLANTVLRKVHMLPIYRQRDVINTAEKNKESFEFCFDVLKKKEHVLIFPEGNHNYKKHLRTPLKKGISRIALGAAEKYNFDLPIYIIPMGLDYSNHFNMNAEMLIYFGKPIDVSKHFKAFQENPTETITNLTKEVASNLSEVMLDIKDEENYLHIYNILHHFPIQDKNKSILEKVKFQQKLLTKIDALKNTDVNQFNQLIKHSESLFNFTHKNKIRAFLLTEKEENIMSSKIICNSLFLLIFFPMHVVGLFCNYIPYKTPVWFVNSKVKDVHFHSSLKLATGVVCFGIFWSILLLAFMFFFCWKIILCCALSLPILAFLNWKYWLILIKTKGRIKFQKLKKNGALKAAKEDFKSINQILEL